MTNASASPVLDGSDPGRPRPVAKLATTRAARASLTGPAGATRLEPAGDAGPEPTLAKTSVARPEPARAKDARPERSGLPTEAAWDGPVDLWVDDIDGDWDSELPWSTRASDS